MLNRNLRLDEAAPTMAKNLSRPATAFTVHVGAAGNNFSPATQTITVGDTVNWVWDAGFHSTTSGTCSGSSCSPDHTWDSGLHSAPFPDGFSFTFTSAGTFHYFCSFHGSMMQGTIIVNPACSFSLSLTSQSFAAAAGAGSFNVMDPGNCGWTATSNNPDFITVTSGSGTGDGAVNYTVMENTGSSPRRGTITAGGQTFTVLQGAHFSDVPNDGSLLSVSIGKLSARGITSGCSDGNYCPGAPVTRAQMAVFLERAVRGATFTPAAASCAEGHTSDFADVACPDFFADFIEQLFHDGITGGCATGFYCPGMAVSRAQMAVFIERAVNGASFMPPAATCQDGHTSDFTDVACPDFFANFIEQLFQDGITGGCELGRYCPDGAVTRGQMAIFLVRAFKL